MQLLQAKKPHPQSSSIQQSCPRDEDAGIFAEENKNDGKITWYLIIPHGGSFAAAQKKRLDSPEVFQQFIMVAEGTPEHRQITACNGGASTSTTPADGPSQGAQSAASVAKLVNQLISIHGPAEHLSGSRKDHIYINLEDSNQYFCLNMGRATAWAKAIRPDFAHEFEREIILA
ncbi:hypothetical protein PTTG_05782 [Puccinia triticina 1-1 BBBD Race 1]|uniref:Uncharacterized protein n=1 Tax=Puccinia triticina (isolate 1-1 / race 1 (BBBD)) TaxID=630390 RepID=A0A180GXM4_PUCT1|nr:hypothetical protein PTTG_05782 [Puccinia triticina 1-1 BBBD Race 1]